MNSFVRTSRLTDQLVGQLTRDIVAGRLAAGAAMPSESELARRFNVSKVAVREATSVLNAFGLVHVQHGKRSVVLDIQHWNILSPMVLQAIRDEEGPTSTLDMLFEARVILEPSAAAIASKRVTNAWLEQSVRLVEAMEEIAVGSADIHEFLRFDRQLHDSIAELVGNPVIRAMIRDLHFQMGENWEESRIEASDLPGVAREHRQIAAAVASGDPERARRAVEAHLETARAIEVGRRLLENDGRPSDLSRVASG